MRISAVSQVVNVATVVALLTRVQDARVLAMLYSLADGPLAAALIAWQCSWVFSSPSHSISVLLHLLPGLALFVYRHMSVPLSVTGVVQHVVSLLPGRGHEAACAPIAGLPVRPTAFANENVRTQTCQPLWCTQSVPVSLVALPSI